MKIFRNKYRVESARLKDWDYSTPWWYYVTICTKNMECFFGEVKNGEMVLNELGKIVKEEWLKTKEIRKKIDLDYFVVMPNHFHGIIIIEGCEFVETHGIVETHGHASLHKVTNNLSNIIRGFKGACTKRIHLNNIKSFSWQSRFYDHIIRNEKDLYRIREYIQNNPLKWVLDEYNCE
jgi:REP element-mobilizing transposase RayT